MPGKAVIHTVLAVFDHDDDDECAQASFYTLALSKTLLSPIIEEAISVCAS